MVSCEPQASFLGFASALLENCASDLHDGSFPLMLVVSPQLSKVSVVLHLIEQAGHQWFSSGEDHDAWAQSTPRKAQGKKSQAVLLPLSK